MPAVKARLFDVHLSSRRHDVKGSSLRGAGGGGACTGAIVRGIQSLI